MTRPELADCGHALPDFPVFTEQHAYCGSYCREWFEPETPKPLFRCRCSASGSQGQCAFGAETADAMQMHYLEQHGWATSTERVVSLDARYCAIAEQAAR